MKDISKKQANIILIAAIFVYVLIMSVLTLKKYYYFEYNLFDLTIFNQVFFNTISGRPFDLTFNLHNYLGDHFTPIIFLLLPIYYIWSAPEMLLVLQSLVLALCAWPIYKIGQKIIVKNGPALLVAFLWLINFIVHSANFYEWHILPLAIFFVLWAIYFYYTKNFNYFLLFSFLTILVREDMFVLLLGLAVLAFLDKRHKKWILAPLFGVLYFLLSLLIIGHFNQGDSNKFFVYYSWLGGDSIWTILWAWFSHPIKFLAHILRPHNIFNLVVIFLSLGMLPCLGRRYLWLLFFPLLQYILTNQGISSIFYNMHYGLVFLPAIFLSAIWAIKKIYNKHAFIFSKFFYNNKNTSLVLLIFTIVYFSFFMSPVKNIVWHKYNKDLQSNRQYFVEQIPEEASLVVSASLAAPLSNRAEIYPLQYSYLTKGQFYKEDFYFPEVGYILLDGEDLLAILSIADRDKDLLGKDILAIENGFRQRLQDYSLIEARDNILLWQNKKLNPSKDLNLYSKNSLDKELSVDTLLVKAMTYEINKQKILRLSYQKPAILAGHYLLRFYKNDTYFDIPLDYGLWSPANWPEDQILSFDYYLDDSVQAYQVFSWQASVALGERKQLSLDMNISPVTKRFDIR